MVTPESLIQSLPRTHPLLPPRTYHPQNLEVKHLIITNINEWYIFDVVLFETLFAKNKKLVQQFQDFEAWRLAGTNTDFFYKEIAQPFVAALEGDIVFTYFNIQDYQKPLRNDDRKDDNMLIALFKLLSPEHLLKLPFTNDSNSLDKRFYSELLHIIGFVERKKEAKLIGRNKEGERNNGTARTYHPATESRDKISRSTDLRNRCQSFRTTLQCVPGTLHHVDQQDPLPKTARSATHRLSQRRQDLCLPQQRQDRYL